MSKTLTADCKSCKEFNIDNNSNFTCKWGKRKKLKIIRDDGRTIEKCNLLSKRFNAKSKNYNHKINEFI